MKCPMWKGITEHYFILKVTTLRVEDMMSPTRFARSMAVSVIALSQYVIATNMHKLD